MDSLVNYTLSTQGDRVPLFSTSIIQIEFTCFWNFPIQDDALKGDLDMSLLLVWSAFKASWSPRYVRFKERKPVPSVSNFVNAHRIILQVYDLSYYQIFGA